MSKEKAQTDLLAAQMTTQGIEPALDRRQQANADVTLRSADYDGLVAANREAYGWADLINATVAALPHATASASIREDKDYYGKVENTTAEISDIALQTTKRKDAWNLLNAIVWISDPFNKTKQPFYVVGMNRKQTLLTPLVIDFRDPSIDIEGVDWTAIRGEYGKHGNFYPTGTIYSYATKHLFGQKGKIRDIKKGFTDAKKKDDARLAATFQEDGSEVFAITGDTPGIIQDKMDSYEGLKSVTFIAAEQAVELDVAEHLRMLAARFGHEETKAHEDEVVKLVGSFPERLEGSDADPTAITAVQAVGGLIVPKPDVLDLAQPAPALTSSRPSLTRRPQPGPRQ